MIIVYSAGIDNETDTAHIFLGRRQGLLKASHDDLSLCDFMSFKDASLVFGCVAISIEEMTRKYESIKSARCKGCKEALKEIRTNFR